MADVRIDGQWLRQYGFVGDVTWSSRWGSGPSGCDQASWTLDAGPRESPSLLRPGRLVEIFDRGRVVFAGTMLGPTRGEPWSCQAIGLARQAGHVSALTSGLNPTTNPEVAVSAAITRGAVQWRSPSGFANANYGAADPVRISGLDALLNEWADSNGLRWGVDESRRAFALPDPTVPTLMLDAAGMEVGVADDSLFTRVNARYVSSVVSGSSPPEPNGWATQTATDPAAEAEYGGAREYELDLTPLGLISGATAANYAARQLELFLRPGWTNRLTAQYGELRTLTGVPAHLPGVRAGQMVRLMGIPAGLARLRRGHSVDVVLGEVSYADGSEEITLAPVGLVARTLADEIAARAEKRKVEG